MVVSADGQGEINFGTVQVDLDIAFDWCAFNEMDEVQDSGSAELQDDGTLTIDFADHLGDEAVLRVARIPFQQAVRRRRYDLRLLSCVYGTYAVAAYSG